MEKKSSSGMNRIVAAVCWGAAGVALVLMLYWINSGSIWLDEAFSLKTIKSSYWGVLRRTASDVHPPLYYFILKFLVDAARALSGGLSVTVVAKFVSVVPHLLLVLLAATKVRRTWGNLTAALFALCAVAMPQMLGYSVEIRMYSWALLFVTASYIWSLDVLRGGGFKNWCIFTLFSLAAAYTHYFALVTVAFNYLFVLIHFLIRDQARLKAWALCAGATVFCYLPWLVVLVRQMRRVGAKYWISPITKGDLVSFLEYPFRDDTSVAAGAIALLLGLSYLALMVGAIRRSARLRDREETDSLLFCVNGAVNWVGTVLFGVVASLVFRPVFIARYMVPALGSLWLGYAILLGRLEGRAKYLRLAALIVLLCAAVLNAWSFTAVELDRKDAFGKLEARLETMEENARLVSNDGYIQTTIAQVTKKESYVWKMTPGANKVGDVTEIRNWLLDGREVYFLDGLPSAKPSVTEIFDGSGILYTDTGEYKLETHEFRLYRLDAA